MVREVDMCADKRITRADGHQMVCNRGKPYWLGRFGRFPE